MLEYVVVKINFQPKMDQPKFQPGAEKNWSYFFILWQGPKLSIRLLDFFGPWEGGQPPNAPICQSMMLPM